jgi:hypothetical protein
MLQTVSQRAPAALPQLLEVVQRGFAKAAKGGSSSASSSGGGGSGGGSVIVKKDWNAVKLPEAVVDAIPTTTLPGQAFVGDLRSTSGLGMGDGKTTHTDKWLTVRGRRCCCCCRARSAAWHGVLPSLFTPPRFP